MDNRLISTNNINEHAKIMEDSSKDFESLSAAILANNKDNSPSDVKEPLINKPRRSTTSRPFSERTRRTFSSEKKSVPKETQQNTQNERVKLKLQKNYIAELEHFKNFATKEKRFSMKIISACQNTLTKLKEHDVKNFFDDQGNPYNTENEIQYFVHVLHDNDFLQRTKDWQRCIKELATIHSKLVDQREPSSDLIDDFRKKIKLADKYLAICQKYHMCDPKIDYANELQLYKDFLTLLEKPPVLPQSSAIISARLIPSTSSPKDKSERLLQEARKNQEDIRAENDRTSRASQFAQRAMLGEDNDKTLAEPLLPTSSNSKIKLIQHKKDEVTFQAREVMTAKTEHDKHNLTSVIQQADNFEKYQGLFDRKKMENPQNSAQDKIDSQTKTPTIKTETESSSKCWAKFLSCCCGSNTQNTDENNSTAPFSPIK